MQLQMSQNITTCVPSFIRHHDRWPKMTLKVTVTVSYFILCLDRNLLSVVIMNHAIDLQVTVRDYP